jgi:cysteine-rich repeat protein
MLCVACTDPGDHPKRHRPVGQVSVPATADGGVSDGRVEQSAADASAPDSRVDAGEPLNDRDADVFSADASFTPAQDSGLACGPDCASDDPCLTATCVEGVCLQREHPDGESCDESSTQLCVDGACVERTGCGDGYREHRAGPAYEACDDGNGLTGDGCSETCELSLFDLSRAPEPTLPSEPLAMGVDARGRVLVVTVARSPAAATLWASRLSARLVLEGDPLNLGTVPSGFASDPVVLGLDDGWAIALSRPEDGDSTGVRLVRLLADGTQHSSTWLHEQREGEQYGARLSRTDTGFLAAWIERADVGDGPQNHVLTRAFADDASPQVHSIALSGSGPRQLLVLCESDVGSAAMSRVRALRLGETQAATLMPFDISPADGYDPTVALLDDQRVAVVYGSRRLDAAGDLWLREVPLGVGPVADEMAMATAPGIVERQASLTVLPPRRIALVHGHGTSPGGATRDLRFVAPSARFAAGGLALLPALSSESNQRSGLIAQVKGGALLVFADDDASERAGTGYRARALFLPNDDESLSR